MRKMLAWTWLGAVACAGDKTEPPPPDGDADTDTDTDADTDADTDTDTDTDTDDGPCPERAPAGPTVDVALGEDLEAAVAAAAPGSTLLLASGTWGVVPPLVLDKAVTLRSATGRRDDVVLDGEGRGGDLVEIRADDVTVAHLTLANAGQDAVSVVADTASRESITLWDLAIVDPGRVAIVADGDPAQGFGLEHAEIACIDASLSAAGRGRVGGECETGGVDVVAARDVVVRDSRFSGFWCATDPALVGIRFWRGSRDIVVERNVLADVATGIVVGQSLEADTRVWPDEPCGAVGGPLHAIDATVRNNIVFAADDDVVQSNDGLTVGVLAESSCGVSIVHNSVYAGNIPLEGDIVERYATTTGIIANNLVSHGVQRLDGALADVVGNVESATFDTWYYPSQGDFHTSPAAVWAIDQGDPAHSVPDDVDGERRTDGAPDVGADER